MTRTTLGRRATAVAVTAVGLAALAGSATAASLYTGAQIKDGSVHGRDVTDGALTGRDVRDRSLTPADYRGAVGDVPGPAGPTGPSGRPGVRDVVTAGGPGEWLPAGRWFGLTVRCPVGTKAVSGGVSGTDPGLRLQESAPLDGGLGWRVVLRNDGTTGLTVYPWVVCARA